MAEAAQTSIVIPAYNEGPVIGRVVATLVASARWHQILVVDDGSTDDTGAAAERHGATVVRHPYNKGNGAAIKSGIRRASGEYTLIIDADGQHRPDDAIRLVGRLGDFDLVVGARNGRTHASPVRRLGNGILDWLAGYLSGTRIPDLTSGFRAARTEYLREFIHLLPNGFSSPTTITLSFLKAGYNVAFEPIDAESRVGRSKIRLLRDGLTFLLIVFRVITIFSPLRIFFPISAAAFVLGAGYAVWTIATQSHVTNSSVLLIMLAVVVFLVGLVSEQIASLRVEGRR
ncbi:MAG: glycosyltransferase family 2 protein [Acidobacteria bacterium]|nr:glycosyltransferase family 2 protein [Acidobacteriota bacterium]MBI3263144.1 glycosyltransferase family 2 protein [Acidobacteriota bacterium]